MRMSVLQWVYIVQRSYKLEAPPPMNKCVEEVCEARLLDEWWMMMMMMMLVVCVCVCLYMGVRVLMVAVELRNANKMRLLNGKY
jgi:hypothetical protein